MAEQSKKPARRGLIAAVGSCAAAALLAFTPVQEGRALKTYRDIGGVLTYCDGATENAQDGKIYTPAECDAQLDRDLDRHAAGIAKCVPMDRLTDGQKVAFVDAAFNIGVPAFCGSSMARRTNAGDMAGACDALLLWNKVGGREVAGLTKRRQRERELCLKGLR
ncbi:lysozyme [Herbaspirillum sp. SJZ107]|uniref:lysozyme n=1 Tax=Herbaspirillum sp. SJZ107 TaxID=2572881 RepID=UPI001152D656|nr:lysozyme [Herbaspirillum sp. SJZ107]TQK10264.1 lysozyme [Herbaspirillum sp. SJZ107]